MGRKPEGKAEKTFKNLGKKLDQMIGDMKGYQEKLKVEYKDQIDELKRNRDTLEKEFKEFKDSDRWETVEQKLEKAADEINEAFKSVFGNKSKEGEDKNN